MESRCYVNMINFIISVVTALNAINFRNSLQLNYCGVRQNASYIYIDSSDILLGVVNNSTMFHYTLPLNETCNFAHDRLDKQEEVESNTSEPDFATVTALLVDERTTTEKIMQENCKCSGQNYYLLFASVLTFAIGLAVKPEELYERMKIRVSQPVYAGNDFARIRTRL